MLYDLAQILEGSEWRLGDKIPVALYNLTSYSQIETDVIKVQRHFIIINILNNGVSLQTFELECQDKSLGIH